MKPKMCWFNGTLNTTKSVEIKFAKYLQNLIKTIEIKTVHKIYKREGGKKPTGFWTT